MGSIVSAITGGQGGANFQGASPDLMTPTNQAQINDAANSTNDALARQAAFAQAVQAQNGIGNQSSVFGQLQNVANGNGPNPAQAMLNQQTAANVANQAALMAGQRGSSSNTGLLARQAAQQGAATQQQAVGQGATLQAQQRLGALNQLGGLATNQVNQQANANNALSNAAQGNQANLLNSVAASNNAQVGGTSSLNSANSSIANTVAGQQGNLFGNIVGGAGSAMLLADGGEVQQPNGTTQIDQNAVNGPKSKVGQHFFNTNSNIMGDMKPTASPSGMSLAGQTIGKGIGSLINSAMTQPDAVTPMTVAPTTAMAQGGQVPALVSPGEKYLSPKDVQKVEKGADPMEVGKKVPGKAKVKGAKNSYANDTVEATLEEGGIVLPRSVTQATNPHWAAHKFVSDIMAKNGKLPKKSSK